MMLPVFSAPETAATKAVAVKQETAELKLIYKEYKKPASDVKLWVYFYDEVKKKWMKHSLTTDKAGAVSLKLPMGDNGKSSVFWFALKKGNMFVRMRKIKKGKFSGLRLLKNEQDAVLEIWVEKGKFGYFVKSGKFIDDTL